MSISIHKRPTACFHLLKHEFDIDGTVDHVVKEFADEPAMQRAKNPRKLARNIVTIGRSGDQQEMNLHAFKQALEWLDQDRQRNLQAEHRREVECLKAQLLEANERATRYERDYRTLVQRSLNELSRQAPSTKRQQPN